jgi:hypothetical protein
MEHIHRGLEKRAGRGIRLVTGVVVGATLVLCVVSAPAAARQFRPEKSSLGGYVDELSTVALTSSSSNFVVPSVTCKKKGAVAFGVELVFATTNTHLTRADVSVNCIARKQVQFSTYASVDGTAEPSEVASMHPGDTVAVAVSCDNTGTSVSIHDQSTGFMYSGASTAPADCDTAVVGGAGECANTSCSKLRYLPEFGSVAFSDALLNGGPVVDGSYARSYYAGPRNQFAPGPLGDGGTAFTIQKTAT